jgi:hypothetical protein
VNQAKSESRGLPLMILDAGMRQHDDQKYFLDLYSAALILTSDF